jgi:hypothetical protein
MKAHGNDDANERPTNAPPEHPRDRDTHPDPEGEPAARLDDSHLEGIGAAGPGGPVADLYGSRTTIDEQL